ncbi:ketoacyl-ACP synthase III family protein [Sphaerisporangium perillae]|uniref:ketoacyl-ACP synthase III family protein n=1 Tax=Sphaerisporangium perillae TaxID=2935860 RepID=UPI0020103BB4|nr:ketoacyl-ACP synthase III family protein [Sphaerisporangium perillae]
MRFRDIHIAATGSAIAPLVPVEEAVAKGACDQETAARTGLVSVAVAGEESPAEMAADAARVALARAGRDPLDIELMLHATVYYQGHDLWPPASYVQRTAVGNRCPAIEVRQMSNGGMAALELAAGYLSAAGPRSAALVTAADKFCPPGFDRWRSDPGTVYADGGVAVMLTRGYGLARLRAVVTVSDPELEGMHRGDDPFGPAPFSVRRPMDLEVWKRAFVARTGLSSCVSRTGAGQREALEAALDEAGMKMAEVDRFLVPHLGRRRLDQAFFRRLGVDPERTTWSWSRRIGHLGAGDQIASLDHLLATRSVAPGEVIMLMGVGAGFTWSCAVVEITECPRWDTPVPGVPGS